MRVAVPAVSLTNVLIVARVNASTPPGGSLLSIESSMDAGEPKALGALMDAAYLKPDITRMPSRHHTRHIVPAGLLRIRLLDLIARDDWETVRTESLRMLFTNTVWWSGS